jgi:hypothetical protein
VDRKGKPVTKSKNRFAAAALIISVMFGVSACEVPGAVAEDAARGISSLWKAIFGGSVGAGGAYGTCKAAHRC